MSTSSTLLNVASSDLEYTTLKVTSAIAKTGDLYRPLVVNHGSKTLAQTVEDMREAGCTVDVRTGLYVLSFFFGHLVDVFKKDGGCTRLLDGFGYMKPRINGSLPTPGADLDPTKNQIEIVFVPSAEFRSALAGMSSRNVSALGVDSRIAQIVDANGVNNTFTGKEPVTISGRNIPIVSGRSDEGVQLMDADMKPVATLTIVSSKLTEVVCSIAEAVPAGKHYTLVLRTRGTRAATDPVIVLTKPNITVA